MPRLVHVADYSEGGPAICGSSSRDTTVDTANMTCDKCGQIMRKRHPGLSIPTMQKSSLSFSDGRKAPKRGIPQQSSIINKASNSDGYPGSVGPSKPRNFEPTNDGQGHGWSCNICRDSEGKFASPEDAGRDYVNNHHQKNHVKNPRSLGTISPHDSKSNAKFDRAEEPEFLEKVRRNTRENIQNAIPFRPEDRDHVEDAVGTAVGEKVDQAGDPGEVNYGRSGYPQCSECKMSFDVVPAYEYHMKHSHSEKVDQASNTDLVDSDQELQSVADNLSSDNISYEDSAEFAGKLDDDIGFGQKCPTCKGQGRTGPEMKRCPSCAGSGQPPHQPERAGDLLSLTRNLLEDI